MSDRDLRRSTPLSVLDRLLADPFPTGRSDLARDPGIRMLRAALRRDLEALLNARKPWRSLPNRLPFVRTSSLAFGLADFAGGVVDDPREKARLCAEIADAITRFEPRLTAVTVELAEASSSLEATLGFRINAVLLVDPVSEPIAFDTMLDTVTSDIHLRVPEDA